MNLDENMIKNVIQKNTFTSEEIAFSFIDQIIIYIVAKSLPNRFYSQN